MTEPIRIRVATVADIDVLIGLRAEVLADLFVPGQPDPTQVAPLARDYFARAIPAGQYVVWLAESGDETVACLALALSERPPRELTGATGEGRVLDVYTRPAWRGRGIAAALLERAVAYAAEAGLRRVHLRAVEAAVALYARAGFVPVKREMELRLGAGPPPR